MTSKDPQGRRISAAMVRQLYPFETLRNENLRALLERARAIVVKPGEHPFRAGQEDRLSFFLLEGTVGFYSTDGRRIRTVEAGSDGARQELAPVKPRRLTLRAERESVLLVVESEFLQIMCTWDKTGSYEVTDLNNDKGSAGDDWMSALLHSTIFQRIPPGNIQALFLRLERRPVRAGEKVIAQGDPGDAFYFLTEGTATVSRVSPHSSSGGFELATLNPGDTFGEEALLSGRERTASVIMKTDGTVMRLGTEDFFELLCKPMLRFVGYDEANALVGAGKACWLDVRLPTEVKPEDDLAGSLKMPLFMVRKKAKTLDTGQHLIVVCDDGGRSTAAAFVLAERGMEVSVLRDGLAGRTG